MIAGELRAGIPQIVAQVSGRNGAQDITLTIDTGFGGELKMPVERLRQLGAMAVGHEEMRLADGFVQRYELFAVSMEWFDEQKIVEAVAIEGDCLLGTALLQNCSLYIEFTSGGESGHRNDINQKTLRRITAPEDFFAT